MKLMNIDYSNSNSTSEIRNHINNFFNHKIIDINCIKFYMINPSDFCYLDKCETCVPMKRIRKMIIKYEKH